ncbi:MULTISPECIES: O-antigen ligase [unclassified Thioalkalivibrio]|uniref:O-antigen ligase family protein n=1 Tax=unclassified Thioalkalivibrio TaxID=2621013 RepID=UPI0018C8E5AA|nr:MULTISPECIES: O-antigen ligase family protein [unclassified Thioalkalivibrio]
MNAGAFFRVRGSWSFARFRAGVRDSRWLGWALAIFLAGFLAAWSTRFHRDVLYLLIVLPFLLAMRWQDWGLLLSSRVFQFLILWVGVLSASMLWSDPSLVDADEVYDKVRYALLTLIFVSATAWVVATRDDWFDRLVLVLIPIAAVVLVYSIGVYYADHPFPSTRLNNMVFYRDSPNRGSVGFLLVALVGLAVALNRDKGYLRILGWVGVAVGVAFILLAQSRALLLGFSVGAVVQLAYFRYWKVLLGLVFGVGAFVVVTHVMDFGFRSFIERADANRFTVWLAVVDRIMQNPWYGEGLILDRAVMGGDGRTYYSPHSIWLMSTLVAGILGVAAWVLLALVAMREAFHQSRREFCGRATAVLGISMFFAGVFLLSFAGHEIIYQVNPHFWLGLWFPLALLVGHELRRRRALQNPRR